MPDLVPPADLASLRREAKERSVADRLSSASAQLAVACEHGFADWAHLETEVERRAILDARDLDQLTALLARNPRLAVDEMVHWCDHPLGAAPLNYVAMLRFDTVRGVWRDVTGAGPVARALLDAGAPVDGVPGGPETPLMTAASYGDAEVAQVLVGAGADLEATASDTAGGVPGGTALLHAAVFGMTAVLDVLVAAGAPPEGIATAAAAGDVAGWLHPDTPPRDRLNALIMAADHQRLDVIDLLVQAGTPVDAFDEVWGRQALRMAVGRPASVRRLLTLGADPNLRDADGRTALEVCREKRSYHPDGAGFGEVEAILEPLTRSSV